MPNQNGQRNQRYHPGKTGVLNPGRGAGGNLAEYPATVLDQFGRLTSKVTKQADGHDQRNHDLHRCHPEVAQTCIESQAGSLQPLGEKGADVGHGAGEVATPHA
jgi:hypothetical protein